MVNTDSVMLSCTNCFFFLFFFVGAVTIKMILKRLFKNYGNSLVRVSKPCTLKHIGVN